MADVSTTMPKEPSTLPPAGGSPTNVGNPVWENLSVEEWRASLYSPSASNCLSELFKDQLSLFRELLAADRAAGHATASVVDSGCGTAELFAALGEAWDYCVGVELSPAMIELAFKTHPKMVAGTEGGKVRLICGNAVTLLEDVASVVPPTHEFWKGHRTATMVMNTLGVLPHAIRADVVLELFKTAGAGGRVVIVCLHKPSLRQGFEEFYSKNPGLCGPCTEADFDFITGDFKASSGYTSHWFDEAELRGLMEPAMPAGSVLRFEVRGAGIMAIADLPL